MPRILSPWGNIFCKFGKEAAVCLDKTIIYTRDAGGNVTQKKVYALSTQAQIRRPARTDSGICLRRRTERPGDSSGWTACQCWA